MLRTFVTKQILAVMAIAVFVCSGAFVLPHQDGNVSPAVEATGVLG